MTLCQLLTARTDNRIQKNNSNDYTNNSALATCENQINQEMIQQVKNPDYKSSC